MNENLKQALKEVEYVLLDMDGTIYLGNNPIGDMPNTLKFLREQGKKIIYLSNNTSKSADTYVEKLTKLGFYNEKDEIYSAGVATCEYLNKFYPGKKVYAMATKSYRAELLKYGINLSEDENCDIALITYDTELNYKSLCTLVKALDKGALYIATHPDNRCNTEDGFIPDIGSFIKMIEVSNGYTPSLVIGKPKTIMGDTLKERFNAGSKKFLMVGDRLDTDICFGLNNEFNTMLVLSGETTMEDVQKYPRQPDFILDSLNDIKKYF